MTRDKIKARLDANALDFVPPSYVELIVDDIEQIVLESILEDRKTRHLKERHQLNTEWAGLRDLRRANAAYKPQDLIPWAVSRWHAEVADRPLENKNRRTLDDTWRQVIHHLGGDHIALLGPTHDELLLSGATTDEQN